MYSLCVNTLRLRRYLVVQLVVLVPTPSAACVHVMLTLFPLRFALMAFSRQEGQKKKKRYSSLVTKKNATNNNNTQQEHQTAEQRDETNEQQERSAAQINGVIGNTTLL